MVRYFAGIGSRKAPKSEFWKFAEIAEVLNDLNYHLNSGGAAGSDQYFEDLFDRGSIFLPWNGFNNKRIALSTLELKYIVPDENMELVRKYHPAYGRLSQAALKLMSRNSYQVLGHDLATPVDFVACWTESGKDEGGTAQACRIARDRNIPVYNLNNDKEFADLKNRLNNEEFF